MNILTTRLTPVLSCCTAVLLIVGGSFASAQAEVSADPHYQHNPMERAHEFSCNGEWSSSGEMNTDLFCIRKTGPAHVCKGDEVTITITVTAKNYVKNVIITDSFAPGVSYVSSEPEAEAHGNHFQWKIDEMQNGETKTLKVTVMADEVGHLCDCLTVIPICRLCRSTHVGDCDLHIEKSGPECLCRGETGCYTIKIRNTGNAMAKNVVLTDFVPAGMSHCSGDTALTYNLGNMQPGCHETINVSLKAVETGNHCNIATVKASNSPEKSAQACTDVFYADIWVTKVGPAETFLCKTATYTITVSNTGTTPLNNVTVYDRIQEGTHIVSAEGGEITCHGAAWKINTLAVGESSSVFITLKSDCLGEYTNRVSATGHSECCGPVSDCAEASTCWKGLPGLQIEMIDSCDPVCIGETTKYALRVKNQGQASANNVSLVVRLPAEMSYVSSSDGGAGSADGQTIAFDVILELAPGQSASYCFTVKGVATGDARVKVEMNADHMSSPVIEEESTTVY